MLSLCATPIGNLGDITYRAVEALAACDAVYCEDTRHSLQLLNHLNIKKPLVSCHEHNEQQRAQELVEKLRAGQHIVYISDAGMPGISDPGAVLVRACIENALPFEILPGASAVLTAAVFSGLPCDTFTFFGFLPRDNGDKKARLAEIAACGRLAILYESPQRVPATLKTLLGALGDCEAAVMRELTKKFETAERGRLSELIARFPEPPRGECVIAVLVPKVQKEAVSTDTLDAALTNALASGLSVRDAAAMAAEALGIPKKEAYQRALTLRKEE